MTIEQFEQQIGHLNQTEILSGSISSLNKLLVDKKIVQEHELQDYFMEWMDGRKKGVRKPRRKSGKPGRRK